MFSKARLILAAGALALAGCASFETERSSRFVDENGAVVSVEYARGEERTTQFVAPNGAKMPYKSKLKVRVTMPDGDRFIAYRHMSLAGVLYKTADEDWEYLEEGTACAVAQRAEDGKGYLLRFQGMMTMNSSAKDAMKKKPRITGSSTPQGFGRPSSGPRDSDGPRTVEKN
jgi:hypothetical protein